MSSNIRLLRVCMHCGNDFTARTTVTKYCSDLCSKRAYKARLRTSKIEASDNQTQLIKSKPIEEIRTKEFLTVRDIAKLFSCSIRTAYRLIENQTLNAVNIAQRKTLIHRSEIDRLFMPPHESVKAIAPQQKELSEAECYTISEVQNRYGISEGALYNLIKRNRIPKMKRGLFVYVPKAAIDKILS